MAIIWEKAKSILAGNLNSGVSYLIKTVSYYSCTISLVKTQARSTRSNSFNVSTTIPGRANRACNTKWGIWNANFLPSIRHILWLNERQKSDHFYYEENNSYLKAMKGKRGGNRLNLSFLFLSFFSCNS